MFTTGEGVPARGEPTNGLASRICRIGLAVPQWDVNEVWRLRQRFPQSGVMVLPNVDLSRSLPSELMNTQALLLFTSPLLTALVAHSAPPRYQSNILWCTSILTSTSTLGRRIFIMATKSLLLSCLLMGLGISQHPISEGNQTPGTPTFTDPADFTTSTDPPVPPKGHVCVASPEDVTKFEELESRVREVPNQTFEDCRALPPVPIPDTPECEVVVEYLAFLTQKCEPEFDVLSHTREVVNSDSSNSWDWTVGPAGYSTPNNTDPGSMIIEWCTSCPETVSCQDLLQLLKLLKGVQLWDDNGVNDKSCPSSNPDDQGGSLRRQRDAAAVVSRPTHEHRLEPQGENEPYHPALKPIYDGCDELENPVLHLMCVLAELERALCEQEPWHRECQDLGASSAEELDLLDDGFDLDGVIPFADDDGFLGQPQVTAPSEPTESARLIEWMSWSGLEPFFQECEHDVGYIFLGDCVYEKMRDEVCSSNPEDELCQVPRATLINALINGRDLPIYTKTADTSN